MSLGQTTTAFHGATQDRHGHFAGTLSIGGESRIGLMGYPPSSSAINIDGLSAGFPYAPGQSHPGQIVNDAAPDDPVPAWLFSNHSAAEPPHISRAQLPFGMEAYLQGRTSETASSLAQAIAMTESPTVPSTVASASITRPSMSFHAQQQQQLPFVDPNMRYNGAAQQMPSALPSGGQEAGHALSSVSRRTSDHAPMDGSVATLGDMPLNHISTSVPPEASGLAASSSPGSSSRTTHSPEDVLKAFSSATHPSDGPISMPLPPSMTSSVKAEPWMNRSSFANDLVGTSQSTIYDAAQASAPSSSTYASKPPASSSPSASNPAGSSAASVPFKTSADRRERNKASQRESRKRKQDRMESLESENAALRKALMDMKKFSEGLSNGAGIKGEDGSEIDPSRLVKFSGAIHLDQIESHLDDETLEPEWKRMVGHRFPASSSNSGDDAEEGLQGASIDSVSGSDEEQDARGDSAVQKAVDGAEDLASLSSATNEDGKVAKSSGPIATSRDSSQQRKKTMWELSLNQRRQKTGSSFPSMVAVPELVLYKVCRLYFSLLLPFTTRLKSGIINLRAARVAPTFFGGCDDLPRFQGDSASDPSAEFYLPPNLMPTESQLRIGFHPVEIAVLPYPSMRDKLLTVLSAFQSIEDVARQAETEARFSPADSSTVIDELEVEDIRTRTALVADMSRWTPQGYVGTMVRPDKSRVYQYGYLEKPKGSHRLQAPAQQWLDAFFLEVVHTLRVWSPAGDVFDPECFEFKESFFRKYPYMVDGQIIRSTNRWRRARGEEPIRL